MLLGKESKSFLAFSDSLRKYNFYPLWNLLACNSLCGRRQVLWSQGNNKCVGAQNTTA